MSPHFAARAFAFTAIASEFVDRSVESAVSGSEFGAGRAETIDCGCETGVVAHETIASER